MKKFGSITADCFESIFSSDKNNYFLVGKGSNCKEFLKNNFSPDKIININNKQWNQ